MKFNVFKLCKACGIKVWGEDDNDVNRVMDIHTTMGGCERHQQEMAGVQEVLDSFEKKTGKHLTNILKP